VSCLSVLRSATVSTTVLDMAYLYDETYPTGNCDAFAMTCDHCHTITCYLCRVSIDLHAIVTRQSNAGNSVFSARFISSKQPLTQTKLFPISLLEALRRL
jgi:hypothetical protein